MPAAAYGDADTELRAADTPKLTIEAERDTIRPQLDRGGEAPNGHCRLTIELFWAGRPRRCPAR